MIRLGSIPLSTRLIALLSLIVFALAVLAGCSSSNFNPPAETVAATSGSGQSAIVNNPFGASLVATVTMGGKPVSGAFVIFTAPSSGASGTFINGTNTETDPTNSSGVAMSTTFTANGVLGTQTVTASLADATASASFTLTNTSGPAASLAATSGSFQDAVISSAFQAPLVVTVFDANGYPVTGASVTFTAPPSPGASGTFASNSSATETDPTNSSGVAQSTAFTANSTLGSYQVTATVAGVSGASVNFSLANVTGPLLSIAPSSGTPQSANVLAAFGAPLAVKVVDAGGNPVSGDVVTFEVPPSGPSGSFAGGVNTATTNSGGIATSAPFSANGTVGTYTVTATVNPGAEPANFILTNSPLYYSFYLSGQEAITGSPQYYALAGSLMIDGNGNVLGGEQDYNDGIGITSPQPSGDSIINGTLSVVGVTPGLTTLTLNTNNSSVGSGGTETFAVQFVNANHALISQFDGTATSSGSLDLQTLSTSVSDGNYAFTLSGVDATQTGASTAFGGVFSVSESGAQISGSFDTNDSSAAVAVLNTAFTGTITAPDSFGRGSITSALGISLNYYLVGPEAIRLIDVDGTDSAVGSAFGQGSGTFSNASLANSIFGVESNSAGQQYAAAGILATVPGSGASGTFSGVADDDEFLLGESPVTDASISGTYTIAANGYGSVTITPLQLGDLSAFNIYMVDPNLNLTDPNNTSTGLGGALLLDLDVPAIGGTATALNGTGFVLTQGSTAASAFTGAYAFGTQAFHLPRITPLGSEYDFVGQTSVNSLVLTSAKGLLSDPFAIFNGTQQDGTDKATFTGTAAPGTVGGRYTMSLSIAIFADPVLDPIAIYQGSGGSQLLWLNEDSAATGTFLGILEQQGSLSGVPAAVRKAALTSRSKRRR